ncbi:MAG: diguanylate cyclase [Clostridium sp.]|nr:MAG: diguanylate cyclase [Clostridium sp.]
MKNKTPASLIFFNISHFQYINEQYGFEEGNKILIHFADLLRKELSNDSIFCRISADKFLALVKTQDKKQITDIFYSMASQLRLAKNDKFVRKVSLIGGVYFIKEKETIYRAIDLANLAARTISQSEKNQILYSMKKKISRRNNPSKRY